MADTAVTSTNVISLAKDTAVAAPAGQAVTTGNVAVLTPAAGKPFKGRYMLVQMVESGSVTTSTATVKAGGGTPTPAYSPFQTPANLAAKGDLAAVTFTSGQSKMIQLELARYLQTDGTVRIAVGGTSGSVTFTVVNLSKAC